MIVLVFVLNAGKFLGTPTCGVVTEQVRFWSGLPGVFCRAARARACSSSTTGSVHLQACSTPVV